MEHQASKSGESGPIHLLILQHGLHGSSLDLLYTQKAFDSNCAGNVLTHVITSNEGFFKTHDGIDVMGTRLADEVGHSLGGLIIRYGIAVLYERGFFDSITPMNLITFASPHVGSRRTPRAFWNPIAQSIVSAICSHTGKQLMLEDDDLEPLLLKMSKPDSDFYKALSLFKHRCLYCNIVKDWHVPYSTAAISSKNPYLQKLSTLKFNAKYPQILEEQEAEEVEDLSLCFKHDPKKEILREILKNLRTLAWQRVGVNCDSIFAHIHIAGKLSMFKLEGSNPTFDAVHHLVDNFLIKL